MTCQEDSEVERAAGASLKTCNSAMQDRTEVPQISASSMTKKPFSSFSSAITCLGPIGSSPATMLSYR